MIGFFKYAANPTMVLGIADQQTNAPAILLPASSTLDRILWNLDNKTGLITLVESGNTLALSIENKVIRGGSNLVLQEKNTNEPTQKWDFASKSGFILSQADRGYLIDDSNRGRSAGSRIQLYAFNGSVAQQWIFVPLSMMSTESE
uniref:RICIN domain-containing protein n=1 Tax=Yersinia frederiksenii TaxID=29484 RepID=UPI001F4BD4FC|nr:RICIN domain-containing protein [Yersinia frederiksenii]ULG19823.1 hypothetical protein 49p1_00112 [Yersinia frederiksenii]